MKLSDKYQPKDLRDIVFPDDDTRTLVTSIAQGYPPDHLILHGPHGTGKSALVQAMIEEAKKTTSVDVFSRHGSQFEAKSQVQNIVKEIDIRYCTVNWNNERRVLVIDEVDMLSDFAQRQLCNIIDNNHYQVQVLMTTNYLDGLDGRLRDRADKIHIPHLPPDAWLDRAQTILKAEDVIENDASVLAALATEPGSIRGMLRALEELCRQNRASAQPAGTV